MKKKKFIFILLLIVIISVGFSAISATLSITGNSTIARNTWDVHFENVQVTSGSVTASTPVISNNDTQVTYNVTLNMPGDFYEFTVDAVNEGTIDAMIQTFSNTGLTTEQEKYLSYSIKYDNDLDVANKHLLAHGGTATYKVRVEYKTDLDPGDLPTSDQTITLTFSVTYEQADSSAIKIYNFATDSWAEIINNVRSGNTSFYHVGDTKTVVLESPYNTNTLRISNMSTPSECSTTGYSQTACGFVLEFVNNIKYGNHNMNASSSNVGGWPASGMRTYLNSTIYNSLPADLRAGIIDTYVVSSAGSADYETSNYFTSTDKLYLLSATELWGYGTDVFYFTSYDSAHDYSRQFDYYNSLGLTARGNYDVAKKGSPSRWWLRSAITFYNDMFFCVSSSGSWDESVSASESYGVSPAFRIG